MQGIHRVILSILAVTAWSIHASAQTGTNLDAADAQSLQRAIKSLPLLIDHPEVLRTLQSKIWQQRQATDDGVNPPPGVPTTRNVRVTPGMPDEAQNEVNTMYGMPTSVTFIDITGAPWPIQWQYKTNEFVKPVEVAAKSNDQADTRRDNNQNQNQPDPLYAQEAQRIAAVTTSHGFQFDVPNAGPGGGNTVNITTISPSPIGGMNVFLQGARAPIPLKLRSVGPQGGEYDSVLTVQVMAHGPLAKPALAVSDNTPETGSDLMFQFLKGAPPATAMPLDIIGLSPDRIRAWRLGQYDYLLTDVTIMGPQPVDSSAGNGVSLFKIPKTPVVTIYDPDAKRETPIYLRDRS